MRAVPPAITLGGAVGIGLFIAFIGLQHGGLVRDDPNTLVALGDLTAPPALLTLFGLAVTLVLLALRVRDRHLLGARRDLRARRSRPGVMPPAALAGACPSLALPGLADRPPRAPCGPSTCP